MAMWPRFSRLGALLVVGASSLGCQQIDEQLHQLLGPEGPLAPPAAKKPRAIGDQLPPEPKKPLTKVVPKGTVDLGIAKVPKDTDESKGVEFFFDAKPIAPSRHRIGYALDEVEYRAVGRGYQEFAASVDFKSTGDSTFTWRPPKGCPNDMSCVFAALVKQTKRDVDPITAKFAAKVKASKLNSLQAAELALAFVQNIPYVEPEDPFGLRPSPLVVAERGGDCDSKALLLWMMLDQIGIDAVIVSSSAHAHSMVGIALPVSGTTFNWRGRKFAFTETTAIGSPIGHINPELTKPMDWRVEHDPHANDDE
jgi:hypothetical protein